jgi:two-component system sensor histidine kinase DegS
MADFNEQIGDELDARTEIIDLLTKEMDNARRRLTEIKDQIESMQNSVDREQTRYTGIATELRTIKENLATVPREDIRDKYDEALDVRFRLATMRGQLEKFESNYQMLEQYQKTYAQILSILQGYDVLPDSSGNENMRAFDVAGVIQAQEEERQRLARQMHDGPAQSLTNFILQAEICQRLFDRNPDRAAEELENLKTNASSTFQKVRDFIFDLRPMMLDDLGVAPTVRRYLESYEEKNDIETKVQIINDDRRLENHREVMIFRSIQDALSMARDYAAPNRVEIKLDMAGDKIKMSVEDDGNGFDASVLQDPELAEQAHDVRVKGMNMLRDKLELIGGTIHVQSSEVDGTVVRMEIPAGESTNFNK